MRKVMLCLLLLCCTFTTSSWAQVQITTFVSDSGVHLRWIGNTDASVEAWVVERSTDGGPFVLITPEPLHLVTSYKEMRQRVGRYLASYYLTLWGVNEERDLVSSDVKRALSAKSVSMHLAMRAAAPELAQLSGEYFFDRSPSGGSCIYRVIPITKDSMGKPYKSETVQVGTSDVLPRPTDITVSGLDQSVQLTWPRTQQGTLANQIVGYHVWKSSSEYGPFERVNLQTVLPLFASKDATAEFTWTDDMVENSDTVYYYVCHVHATGALSTRSNICRVVVGSDEAPKRPIGVRAERFGHAVRLTWSWSAQGPPPQQVHILRIQSGGTSARMEAAAPTDTTYIDALAEMGNVYRYAVVASSGDHTSTSDTISFTLTDVVPPSPPHGLQAKADTGKILLTWLPSIDQDVAGYVVFVAADSAFRNPLQLQSTLVQGTSFTDVVERTAQDSRQYTVKAVDRSGNTSAPSQPLIVKPIDLAPPAPSQITSITLDDSTVSLAFTASISQDVAAYSVERSTAGTWQTVGKTTQLRLTDVPGITGAIRYRVVVIDSSGNRSKPSQERSVTITPTIEAPQLLTISKDTFALRLTWKAVSNAAGYRIARIDKRTGDRVIVDNVGSRVTSWADRYADPDQGWIYEVAARTNNWKFGVPISAEYRPRQ